MKPPKMSISIQQRLNLKVPFTKLLHFQESFTASKFWKYHWCLSKPIEGVPSYALSFFALKLVNYSFFFWLPYFLHNQYNWSDTTGMCLIKASFLTQKSNIGKCWTQSWGLFWEHIKANVLSTWFDVGGIIGGTVGGIGKKRVSYVH